MKYGQLYSNATADVAELETSKNRERSAKMVKELEGSLESMAKTAWLEQPQTLALVHSLKLARESLTQKCVELSEQTDPNVKALVVIHLIKCKVIERILKYVSSNEPILEA